MTTIALEGMHFHAYHGYYEEEREIGNHFIVDVYVEIMANIGGTSDELGQTVNYETIYLICQAEMKKNRKLLEKIAQSIGERIKGFFDQVQSVRVRVRKLNPPLGGRVDSAYVEVEVKGGFGGFRGEEDDEPDFGSLSDLFQ
jgi:dihydroneopterin aldolase